MSDNFNNESTNVLIIGKSGVGKSSLVNYLFGKELQPVGVGAPVTKMEIKEFTYKYDEHFEMEQGTVPRSISGNVIFLKSMRVRKEI